MRFLSNVHCNDMAAQVECSEWTYDSGAFSSLLCSDKLSELVEANVELAAAQRYDVEGHQLADILSVLSKECRAHPKYDCGGELAELDRLLNSARIHGLLMTYDGVVGERDRQAELAAETVGLVSDMREHDDMVALRLVGLNKVDGEAFGVHAEKKGEAVKVIRVVGASLAARSGLLQVGDQILAVNGKQVTSVDELMDAVESIREGIINLIVLPAPPTEDDSN